MANGRATGLNFLLDARCLRETATVLIASKASGVNECVRERERMKERRNAQNVKDATPPG